MSKKLFRVLWVYQVTQHGDMKKYEAGQKPSLCFKGREHMMCVAAGHPVRVLKRDASDWDKLRPVDKHGIPHDPLEAAAKLREIGARCGITEGAKKILGRAEAAVPNVDDLDEDDFTNEEDSAMITDETKSQETGDNTTQPKEPKVSKTKKAKKTAVAKPKKDAMKKNVAVKKPSANPMGREGSITAFINKLLVAGKDNDTIAAAAKKEFPKAKAVDAKTISWYRWNAGRKGLIKKAK